MPISDTDAQVVAQDHPNQICLHATKGRDTLIPFGDSESQDGRAQTQAR